MEPIWWIGVVESKEDPEQRGRIQVRIVGVHTEIDKSCDEKEAEGLATADLPWASCLMPLTYGGTDGATVAPPAVCVGAWVMGLSLDGDAYQNLLTLGIISLPFCGEAVHDGTSIDGAGDLNEDSPICKDKFYDVVKSIEEETNGDGKNRAQTILEHLDYLKQNDKAAYDNFVATSGVSVGEETSSLSGSAANEVFGKGYYEYLYNKTSDPVVAALAYNMGLGEAERMCQLYGDPSKAEISYADMAAKMAKDGRTTEAKYVSQFAEKLGAEDCAKCLEAKNVPPFNGKMCFPTNDPDHTITSIFHSKNRKGLESVSVSARAGKPHMGIDIRAHYGTPLYAMEDGVVVCCSAGDRFNGVYIQYDGYVAQYLHCSSRTVKKGDKVKPGDIIGYAGIAGMGSSAKQSQSHLHLAIIPGTGNLNAHNAIDGEAFLKQRGLTFTRKPGA